MPAISLKLDRAVVKETEKRIGILLGATALDHRSQRAVGNPANRFEFILMTVTLKNDSHHSGILEDLSDFCRLLNGMLVGSVEIETLVRENHGG